MVDIRERWTVVFLLLFATAGVTPQLSAMAGNAVALIGICTIGLLALLNLNSIAVLRKPVFVFFLLVLFVALRAVVSTIQMEGTTLVHSIRAAVYIFSPIITVLAIPNTVSQREALIGSLIVVMFICGLGVVGVIINSPVLGLRLIEVYPVDKYILFGDSEIRPVAISVFDNPNRLSAFAIVGVIGGGGLWWLERSKFGLIAATIAIVTMIFAGSRTPFLAIPAAFVVSVFLRFNFREYLIIGTSVFFLAIPIIVFSTVIDPSVVASVSLPRAELWAGSVQAISENPVFGYGFGEAATGISEFVPSSWAGAQPHSAYVKITVSGGLLVGIFYGLLIFGSIISRMRVGTSGVTSIWLVLSFSYLSVQLFESFSMFSLTPTSLLIGLSTGYVIHNRKNQRDGCSNGERSLEQHSDTNGANTHNFSNT